MVLSVSGVPEVWSHWTVNRVAPDKQVYLSHVWGRKTPDLEIWQTQCLKVYFPVHTLLVTVWPYVGGARDLPPAYFFITVFCIYAWRQSGGVASYLWSLIARP